MKTLGIRKKILGYVEHDSQSRQPERGLSYLRFLSDGGHGTVQCKRHVRCRKGADTGRIQWVLLVAAGHEQCLFAAAVRRRPNSDSTGAEVIYHGRPLAVSLADLLDTPATALVTFSN